jgi:hypothetical protein
LILEILSPMACPNYCLGTGDIVDVPADEAKRILAKTDSRGKPAAEVVTDTKKRAKAKKLDVFAGQRQEPKTGWIGE